MISIECHRSGERCPGKREFDNRIEINRVRSGEIDVAIPFNLCTTTSACLPPVPPEGRAIVEARLQIAATSAGY